MTAEKENGPAGNRAVQESKAWTYKEHIAARRRRRDAAARLEPIQCSGCAAWIRDPLEHRCHESTWTWPTYEPSCGCYQPDLHGHRNETCSRLGELSPPRLGPGSRR